MVELDSNQVAVSTMSATYYLVALKTGLLLRTFSSPFSKSTLDLIRLPSSDFKRTHLLCGVETDAYVLLDFSDPGGLRLLERERATAGNQSPWYTGAFFMEWGLRPGSKAKPQGSECMIVAEEKKRAIRSFVVNGL